MKILIWAMARALGDGVNNTGYPREIKRVYPEAQVDLFCTRMHAAAFKGNPYIDNIYYFNTYNKPFSKITRTKIYLNPLMQMKNLLKARREKYDIVIDVDSSYKWQNRFMVKFIMGGGLQYSTRHIVGKLKTNNKRKYSKNKLLKTYTILTDEKDGSTYTYFNKNIDCLAHDELFIPIEKEDKAINFYKQNTRHNNKVIIFNGEGSDKSISSSKTIDTLTAILDKYPEYYIFILGYNNYYEKYKEIIDTINNPRLQMTYKTDILDTFALLKYANLLISVDTALIHIASAFHINICEIISRLQKGYYVASPKHSKCIVCENKEKYHTLDGYHIDEVVTAVKQLIS